MARVNIHLPDQLHKKIQNMNINVSAICQVALEKEVRRKETLNLEADKMQQLKQKVLQQKEDWEAEDFEEGRKLAKEWAEENQLNYEDFIHAERDDITDESKEGINEILDDRIKSGEPVSEKSFREGFITGVQEIRAELDIDI